MNVARLIAPDGSGVEVRFLSRAYPGGLSVFDDDWLNTEVLVQGGRPWRFQAFLRTTDLAAFVTAAHQLLAGTTTVARFEPRDAWLVLQAERADGDTPGVETGFNIEVFAHEFDSERQRSFRLCLTDAAFTEAVSGFAAAASAFPVRGPRNGDLK